MGKKNRIKQKQIAKNKNKQDLRLNFNSALAQKVLKNYGVKKVFNEEGLSSKKIQDFCDAWTASCEFAEKVQVLSEARYAELVDSLKYENYTEFADDVYFFDLEILFTLNLLKGSCGLERTIFVADDKDTNDVHMFLIYKDKVACEFELVVNTLLDNYKETLDKKTTVGELLELCFAR